MRARRTAAAGSPSDRRFRRRTGPFPWPAGRSSWRACRLGDWDECCRLVGDETARRLRDLSLQIYSAGRDHAASRGIIVADTKFEFGLLDDQLLLIDECLTPDSSRFWPAESYAPGQSPPSFDKQFVRDYLATLDWDKTSPGPSLPAEVIEKTTAKYREAFRCLTSTDLV